MGFLSAAHRVNRSCRCVRPNLTASSQSTIVQIINKVSTLESQCQTGGHSTEQCTKDMLGLLKHLVMLLDQSRRSDKDTLTGAQQGQQVTILLTLAAVCVQVALQSVEISV